MRAPLVRAHSTTWLWKLRNPIENCRVTSARDLELVPSRRQ